MRDYQDYPAWRRLTVAYVSEVARHTGGHVLVPMTVLNAACAAEIFDALDTGPGLVQLVLHADPHTLGARIAASEEFSGDETRSEAVRAHRRRRASDCTQTAEAWMHAAGHVIDTSSLTSDEVLHAALDHLSAAASVPVSSRGHSYVFSLSAGSSSSARWSRRPRTARASRAYGSSCCRPSPDGLGAFALAVTDTATTVWQVAGGSGGASGLLLIRSDAPGEPRLGWGVLGSSLPVRFPQCLRPADAHPFAVQPARP
ncbi:hypothetical protein [Streptomyces lavendulae]|uniref:hypothetical protein n=1 Tax=Streptomyces lavendulae TaxID=1914 RepID=UPI003D9E769D